MNQDKFSKFIKDIRLKNNLTQKEFADMFGVTYQAVSKWENGINMPDLSIVKQICSKYNMSIDEFLNAEIDTKKKNKKLIIIISSILLLVVLIIIILSLNKNTFKFKTISSGCDSFTLTGSMAYDNDKSSIYISNIIYCGKEFNGKYKKISASLYEKNGNNIQLLDKTEYTSFEPITITEFLKDKKFNIDRVSKMCKEYEDDNLYIEIEAIDNEETSHIHKIPLKVEENCKIS